jgi:hypothetical protein
MPWIIVFVYGFFFFFFLGPVCIGSASTSAFKAYCAIVYGLVSGVSCIVERRVIRMIGKKMGQNGCSLMDVYSPVFVERLNKITKAPAEITDVLGELRTWYLHDEKFKPYC